MGLIRNLTAPLRRAAFLFFRAQVELRVDRGVRVALNERPGERIETAEERAARREQAELDLIRRELAMTMEAAPEIRAELRHLAFVEHALVHKGLRALAQVPPDVLQKALEQFEGLVSNWEPRGLATLRSKMAVQVRRNQSETEPASTALSEASDA
jgi:hypothetical protein